MLVCKKCKMTKLEGKWIPTHNLRKNVTYTLCPTCNNEVKQDSRGSLYIDIRFFQENNRQSVQLIQMEEKRARSQNIYSRIVQIKKDRKYVIVKTTSPLLAVQLGKQFKRMFKGQLDITRDKQNRTMVRWFQGNGESSTSSPDTKMETAHTIG